MKYLITCEKSKPINFIIITVIIIVIHISIFHSYQSRSSEYTILIKRVEIQETKIYYI